MKIETLTNKSNWMKLVFVLLAMVVSASATQAQDQRQKGTEPSKDLAAQDRAMVEEMYAQYPDNAVVSRAYKNAVILNDEQSAVAYSADQLATMRYDYEKSVSILRSVKARVDAGYSFEESFNAARQNPSQDAGSQNRIRMANEQDSK
ncbi:MAG: hypothetical protein ACKOYC_11030 [Bacteroidota bacterium]